jgi:trimethylamine--corrinoid protein Co-methyltransferase
MPTAALSDLTHHYGLPCWSQSGMSESKGVDAQTGTKYALGMLSAALAGANLILAVGYLAQGLTSSLESCVLADEAISMMRRFMLGIEVTPETLAVGVVDRVGPNGNFLSEEHTLKYMRSEIWYPTVFERRHFEDWAEDGAIPLKVRLRERAVEILKTHRPVLLPGETLKVLRGIAGELRTGSNLHVSPLV